MNRTTFFFFWYFIGIFQMTKLKFRDLSNMPKNTELQRQSVVEWEFHPQIVWRKRPCFQTISNDDSFPKKDNMPHSS